MSGYDLVVKIGQKTRELMVGGLMEFMWFFMEESVCWDQANFSCSEKTFAGKRIGH